MGVGWLNIDKCLKGPSGSIDSYKERGNGGWAGRGKSWQWLDMLPIDVNLLLLHSAHKSNFVMGEVNLRYIATGTNFIFYA